MNELPEEKDENYEKNRGLELNCLPHTPLEIKEELIRDVFDFLEGQPSRSQVILLCHRELVVVIIDFFLSAF